MINKKITRFGLAVVLTGSICFLIWHKKNINSLYREFQITTIHVKNNEFIPISKNSTMQVNTQYLNNNGYHAKIKVQSKNKSSLSIANWYLFEGLSVAPNQFGTPTINDVATHTLRQGENIVKINTNYQIKQEKHSLVVAFNHAHGKYRLLYFSNH